MKTLFPLALILCSTVASADDFASPGMVFDTYMLFTEAEVKKCQTLVDGVQQKGTELFAIGQQNGRAEEVQKFLETLMPDFEAAQIEMQVASRIAITSKIKYQAAQTAGDQLRVCATLADNLHVFALSQKKLILILNKIENQRLKVAAKDS